ncbi:MAG: hypothetical protein V4529_17110 [Gemmatimonadota bacterium]
MKGRGKSRRNIDLIEAARAILSDIQPATVRAVCYQLFTRGLIASMAKNETNKVSTQLRDAREAGSIPWAWIVDETREPERINAWENPAAFVETVKRSYRRDRWAMQPEWIEVWSEKGTIRGTLAPVLDDFGVTFRVMHGYGSSTALHQAADDSNGSAKRLTVLYVGDWDPSGMHMSDVDLPARLARYGGNVEIVRVALTAGDLAGLPSFPAKPSDVRYRWYRERYGDKAWELDALNPATLRERVENTITMYLDIPVWNRAGVAERAEQESLTSILNTWPGISRPASESGGAV